MDKWFDIQDQQGNWQVGYLIRKQKQDILYVCPDGYHPNNCAYYCQHSGKILSVRSHTKGLTIPQDHKTIRNPVTLAQLQIAIGKLQLYNLQSRLVQLPIDSIRINIRTQLLILIDKIMTGPYQVIKQQKLAEISISKVFITILNLYFKIVEGSKKFIPLLQSNASARELYKSLYQLTQMVSMIIGLNPRSNNLYNHELNLTLKSEGYLNYFVTSENNFPFQFKTLFSSLQMVQCPTKNQDLVIALLVINFFLDICENKKQNICAGKYQQKTLIVIEQIIALIKDYAQKNQQIKQQLNIQQIGVISRIQSIYTRLKKGKSCTLRNYISKQPQSLTRSLIKQSIAQIQINNNQNFQKQLNDSKIKIVAMEQQIKNLHQKMQKLTKHQQQTNHKLSQAIKLNGNASPAIFDAGTNEGVRNFLLQSLQNQSTRPVQLPKQNLGQQVFLGSVQWALQTGQIQTAQKLVKWRRSLLQIGRIVGWQIATVIGCRTYKKGVIEPQDIIDANYEYIAKNSNIALPALRQDYQKNVS